MTISNTTRILSVLYLIMLSYSYSYAYSVEDVAIHGFVSQGYIKSSDNNFLADTEDGTFQSNEMGINFSKKLAESLKFGLQFFARDLGDVGNDKVEVDWGFGDYSFREWLGVRFGLIKTPAGLYSETRDIDNLRTCIILPQGIYNEWDRDTVKSMKGIGLYGNIPIKGAGTFRYQAQYGKTQVDTDSGTGQYILKLSGLPFSKISSIDVDDKFLFYLDWLTPIDGLRGAFTYRHAGATVNAVLSETDVVFRNSSADSFITSLEYIKGNFTFASEWMWTETESSAYNADNSTLLTLPPFGTIPRRDTVSNFETWYISGSYRFNEWFEFGMYYSKDDGRTNGSGEKNRLYDICSTLRFDINPFWTLKLEAHIMDGLRNTLPGNDGKYEYDGWYLFAAKASCTF